MPFSDKEVETMRSIFLRLEPGIIAPIQFHNSESLTRTGYVFGVCNWKKEYTLLYQNYNNLSPYRMKLLVKLAKNIPYKLQITHPREDIICVGWKFE
jgi:hypothetical protein